MNGLENPGVLDAFAHDTRTDRLVLAMYESRPWNGDGAQLHQLQEKLNAYLSFILDGEMTEAFPQLAGKPVEIQLRTAHEPEEKASDLIRRIREQLAFQEIGFEVIQITEDEQPPQGGGGCGSGCGCAQ
jgi:hypothetical protein